jgi:hypothetical protein
VRRERPRGTPSWRPPAVPRYCRRAAIAWIPAWPNRPCNRGLRGPGSRLSRRAWGSPGPKKSQPDLKLGVDMALSYLGRSRARSAGNFLSGSEDHRHRRLDPATIMTDCGVIRKLSIQIEKSRSSTTNDTGAQERAATAGGTRGHDECPCCNPIEGAGPYRAVADGSAARVRGWAKTAAWI